MSAALYPALRGARRIRTQHERRRGVRRRLRLPDQPGPRPADRRPRPPSQADLVRQALAEDWPDDRLRQALDANSRLHDTH